MKFFSHLSLLVLLPLLFVSCDSSDSNRETGTLRVLLTDVPANYKSVFIDVQKVRIHRSTDAEVDDSGWIDIINEPLRLDLRSLVNGNVALL